LTPRTGENLKEHRTSHTESACSATLPGLVGESSGAESALAVTTMRTVDGDDVGTAYVHRDDPGWLVTDVRDWEQRRATRYATGLSRTAMWRRAPGSLMKKGSGRRSCNDCRQTRTYTHTQFPTML
jgi:hypothetical protein